MPNPTTRGIFLNELNNPTDRKRTNYLLVIGIDEYVHCPKLFNCVKDAEDLIEVLTERFLFEKENVATLFNENATRANIYKAFRKKAAEITPDDNLVIYFSGHGEYDKIFNQGYWIPIKAQHGEHDQYIPNSEIRTFLSAIKSHHTFLISDSCFSGALFAKGLSKNVSRRYEKDPSRWGLTAGRNEIVSDGKPGDNSPFSESLLYQLRGTEEGVGVAELCSKVTEYVQTNSNQTPIGEPLKVIGHKSGQFVFHLKKSDKKPTKPKSQNISLSNHELYEYSQSEKAKEQKRSQPKPQLKEKPFYENLLRQSSMSATVWWFATVYLFISFVSYLFTWHIDQDRVLKFSWGLLVEDTDMANWLGRLGAVTSNMFFYWGFGICSFGFLYLTFLFGYAPFKKRSISDKITIILKWIFKIGYVSTVIGFLSQGSEFPWGGAFGSSFCKYLQSFLGPIGFVIVIIFTSIFILSPNFRQKAIELIKKRNV